MPNQLPEIIYHYTSQSGLLGILKDGAIRATDLFYLNDYSEFNHAIQIAKDKLSQVSKTLYYDANYESGVIYHVEQLMGDISHKLETLIDYHFYTTSFSANPDSLSQWKLYGSNFRGFSIGFSRSALDSYGNGEGDFSLQECEYEEEKQKELVSGILSDMLNSLHQKIGPKGLISKDVLMFEINLVETGIERLIPIFTKLKKSSFQSEEEWRIVRYYKDDTYKNLKRLNAEFRESTLSLVPYELIHLPKDGYSIKKIIFGSALDKGLAQRSLELLLAKYEITAEIKQSDITVRNLS